MLRSTRRNADVAFFAENIGLSPLQEAWRQAGQQAARLEGSRAALGVMAQPFSRHAKKLDELSRLQPLERTLFAAAVKTAKGAPFVATYRHRVNDHAEVCVGPPLRAKSYCAETLRLPWVVGRSVELKGQFWAAGGGLLLLQGEQDWVRVCVGRARAFGQPMPVISLRRTDLLRGAVRIEGFDQELPAKGWETPMLPVRRGDLLVEASEPVEAIVQSLSPEGYVRAGLLEASLSAEMPEARLAVDLVRALAEPPQPVDWSPRVVAPVGRLEYFGRLIDDELGGPPLLVAQRALALFAQGWELVASRTGEIVAIDHGPDSVIVRLRDGRVDSYPPGSRMLVQAGQELVEDTVVGRFPGEQAASLGDLSSPLLEGGWVMAAVEHVAESMLLPGSEEGQVWADLRALPEGVAIQGRLCLDLGEDFHQRPNKEWLTWPSFALPAGMEQFELGGIQFDLSDAPLPGPSFRVCDLRQRPGDGERERPAFQPSQRGKGRQRRKARQPSPRPWAVV